MNWIKNTISVCLAVMVFFSCEEKPDNQVADFPTHFEESKGTETATYRQTIDFYIALAKALPEINIQTIGSTDSGLPLHMVTYNPDADFNFKKIIDEKTVVLINNGIHPGESDGIDATMLLFRDLATGKANTPKETVLVTIPIYNVGGALNRNSTTRANQNGPKEYGFRGNAKNYDLNRDFIKNDTQNAKTFARIFHLVQPDIFIDNHVSNGADYQYTLTHLFTQHNKLGGELGAYLNTSFVPDLEKSLEKMNWDITPYVYVYNRPPDDGFPQFLDHPRYSTGYTTLWNTLGLMVETHMLKPYKQRVKGTYDLMLRIMDIAEKDHDKIKELRQKATEAMMESTVYPLHWKIDSTRTSFLNFEGYEADTIVSDITGKQRLKYNTDQPFTKKVVYHNYYAPKDTVTVPDAYIIKKAWGNLLEFFDNNNITYHSLEKDTTLLVESYRIAEYKTSPNAYEGHYRHYNTKVNTTEDYVTFDEGDILVPTRQPGIRYLLETLEPEAADSFFNWNFFDTILQRKEGFSPYVFEEYALDMLNSDQKLGKEFIAKKEIDPEFANDAYAQLDWLYKQSDLYEKAHLQYPMYRLIKGNIDIKGLVKD